MNDIEREEEEQEERHYDNLAQHVMDCFDRARQHRDGLGITEQITDSLRRYRGKYDDFELTKFAGISVYRGLTGMLVRSLNSWLKDAYFNAEDRPWTMQPTPRPDLPEFLEQELEMAIQTKIQEQLQTSGFGSISSIGREEIAQLRNTAHQMAFEYATASAEGMTALIEDQMTEANFKDIFQEFLLNICIFPYAVLKGPFVKMEVVPVWENNRYKFKPQARYAIEAIHPIDFFVSPDAKDVQDGEFTIEVSRYTRARLIAAKKLKGFSADAIDLVMSNVDSNNRRAELMGDDAELEDLDGVDRDDAGDNNDQSFTVYIYNGRISGELLIEYMTNEDDDVDLEEVMEDFDAKVDTDIGKLDPYEDYEAQIWVCNDIVIMSRITEPEPVPLRPYYVTSAYKIPGSIYGESLPGVIADLQDELNTAARSRVFNMGMSSGPIAVVDTSKFQDNEVPTQIRPWMVIPTASNTTQGNNTADPVKFTQIPNVSAYLTQVMDEVWEKAHRISGIPPYMYGDNQGAAPTLGAFSLQYSGATKGVKSIIANIDTDIIEKLVTQFYYFNMFFSEDESIKADARVKVRGASGLIAQEQRQARPLELLNALGPILAQMQPETALALANETLKESGYDPASLGAAMGNADAEARNRMIGNQGPSPDGRSGQVPNQLAQQQLPAPI